MPQHHKEANRLLSTIIANDIQYFKEDMTLDEFRMWFQKKLNRPPEPHDLYFAGKELFLMGAYPRAKSCLELYVKLPRPLPPGHHLLGYTFYMLNRPADAIPLFRKCVQDGFDNDWQLLIELQAEVEEAQERLRLEQLDVSDFWEQRRLANQNSQAAYSRSSSRADASSRTHIDPLSDTTRASVLHSEIEPQGSHVHIPDLPLDRPNMTIPALDPSSTLDMNVLSLNEGSESGSGPHPPTGPPPIPPPSSTNAVHQNTPDASMSAPSTPTRSSRGARTIKDPNNNNPPAGSNSRPSSSGLPKMVENPEGADVSEWAVKDQLSE